MSKRFIRIIRKTLLWGGGLLIAGVAGALLVAYSGVYSVAASRGHPAWLDWFLRVGMTQSVETNSAGVRAPDLDGAGLVELGAGHFQSDCAPCHGAPGEPVSPIFARMLPAPPKLERHVRTWTAEELFWIVKHGLQYTGMPAWSGEDRDDEVWAVVAFLQVLPDLSETSYRDLAYGNAPREPRWENAGEAFVELGRPVARITACARCHGTADAAPTSPLVPRLAGQSAAYLHAALEQYRAGERESGFMEPVAAELDDAQIALVASYYATLGSSPREEAKRTSPEVIERGRRLAERGYDDGKIPPCRSCHGEAALPAYPRLRGQSAAYIKAQLELWRRGGRAETATGALMADIAGRLEPKQIDDVAAYYESLPPFPASSGSVGPTGPKQ